MGSLRGMLGTLQELFRFMWKQKLWWLIPMVLVLLLFVVLIVLGSSTPAGPFIYTLF